MLPMRLLRLLATSAERSRCRPGSSMVRAAGLFFALRSGIQTFSMGMVYRIWERRQYRQNMRRLSSRHSIIPGYAGAAPGERYVTIRGELFLC